MATRIDNLPLTIESEQAKEPKDGGTRPCERRTQGRTQWYGCPGRVKNKKAGSLKVK